MAFGAPPKLELDDRHRRQKKARPGWGARWRMLEEKLKS